MSKFEEVVPGSAERILRYGEREQEHRHQMNKIQVKAMERTTSLASLGDFIGRIFGIVFLLGTFGVACYFAFQVRSFEFAALFYSPSIIFAFISLIKGRK